MVGTQTSVTDGSQPSLTYSDEELESPGQSSQEEREDSDQSSLGDTRPGGHLFSADDMEDLLQTNLYF